MKTQGLDKSGYFEIKALHYQTAGPGLAETPQQQN